MDKHLWEANHSYYCTESNYYAPESDQPEAYYKSLADFLIEEGDSDLDLNLLFRWDWTEGGEDNDGNELPKFNGDFNYRNGRLTLFWMGQRKGLYRWSIVEVCRADEPEVINFLRKRMQHLFSLWAPLYEQAS